MSDHRAPRPRPAGAYPVITVLLAALGPATAAWPLPLRTLLLSALMVGALTWLVIPSLTRLFRGWLASRRLPLPSRPRRTAVATAIGIAGEPAASSSRRCEATVLRYSAPPGTRSAEALSLLGSPAAATAAEEQSPAG